MSLTDVDICNLALGYLGTNPIVALADATTEARLCNAFYGPVKLSLLEERNWTFAKHVWTANLLGALTNSKWVAEYLIPANCIRVHRVDDGSGAYDIEWERVGDRIYTDQAADPIYVEGVDDSVTENTFSSAFCFALAARLAAEICIPLTENTTLWQSMHQLAEKKLKEAAGSDGSQGKSEQVRSASSLKQRR